MATRPTSVLVQHLRRAVLRDGAGLPDGQLLESYITHRDEAAFGALVRRHGPMVWGVCRRILSNHQDAEDAFQASFLVLVRKATSVVPREMVANWLHGVAYQTARKARASAAKRRSREKQVKNLPEAEVVEPDLGRDLRPLLDEELKRLPERYRIPILLCDLDGMTYKDAARQLGVAEGTLASRLARARAMLAGRFARRGVAVAIGSVAMVMSQQAAAAGVPILLLSSTIKVACLFPMGRGAVAMGQIAPEVAALARKVLKTMLLTNLKIVAAVLFIVGAIVGASGFLNHRAQAAEEVNGNPSRRVAGRPPQAEERRLVPPDNDIPTEEEARELSGPQIHSRLKVRLAGGKVVSPKDRLPLVLTFTNFEVEPQEFLHAELQIALLDKHGEQVNGGIIQHDGMKRKIVLQGRTTTIKPAISLDPVVKRGEEYYLFCRIRNQTGMVKFTTKR